MKKIQKYKRNLPIKNLFDTLDVKKTDDKKVIAIAGKINTKKTKLLNAVYQYKKSFISYSENDKLTGFQKTINENSLSLKAEKENKKKLLPNSLNIESDSLTYKNITSVSLENFVKDIGWILRDNAVIENTYQWKYFKFIGKLHNKFLIKRVIKKINGLETTWKKSFYSNKTKMIFPVLTTISTIGTSIGVPILSISFFRQEQIINTISWNGYIGILSFCAILIGIGIISVISYLFTVMFVNKKDYLFQNLSDGYAKLISKYFILPSQDINKVRNVKRKIQIKKSYNLFYNEVNYSSSHFDEYMKLIMILHALNNNVIFTLNVNDKFDFKQTFSNQWGASNNYGIIDVESYKVGYSIDHIISFLLNELSKSIDFDINNLYRKNKKFAFVINTFCEMTTYSLQLVEFLNNCKKIFEKNFTNLINSHKNTIDYILDLFTIIAFKSLNSYDFLKFVEKIENEFEISEKLCETYSSLKIKEVLIDNWNKYGINSLISNLNNVYEDTDFFSSSDLNLNIRKNDFNKQEAKIMSFFNNKKFEKTNDKKIKNSLMELINNQDEKAIIFSVDFNKQNFNIFDEIKLIKEKCLKEDFLYLAINLGDNYLIFQQTIGKYQLLANGN